MTYSLSEMQNAQMRKAVTSGDLSVCFAQAACIEQQSYRDAVSYLRSVHKEALRQERRELIGDIMFTQAQIFDRAGHSMACDLHALEAAQAYADYEGNLQKAHAALDMISS